jgi:tryptophan synthase alpha chain
VAGFGIRSAEQASEVAAIADGVVVGSALVQKIEDAVSSGDDTKLIADVGAFCASLSAAMQRK